MSQSVENKAIDLLKKQFEKNYGVHPTYVIMSKQQLEEYNKLMEFDFREEQYKKKLDKLFND